MSGKKYLILCAALIAVLFFLSRRGKAESSDDDHQHEKSKEPRVPHSEPGAHKEHDDHEDDQGHDADHGHEESSSKFGPGKAIEAVKEEGNLFKLSEKSAQVIGIRFGEVSPVKQGVFAVPKSAVVYFRDESGIYVQRDGWFEMIDVDVLGIQGTVATIGAKRLRPSDKVVVAGVALLRVAHLEASGQGGEGHVH